MSETFDAVKAAFAEMGWTSHEVPGREVLETSFEAHHTRVPVHVQAFDELSAITAVAQATVTFKPHHLAAAAELLMRLNRELTVGNFEVDPDLGTVLYRATNLFPRGKADTAIIAGLIHTAVAEMDRAAPLLAILARADERESAALDVKTLAARDDLIPEVPEPPATGAS